MTPSPLTEDQIANRLSDLTGWGIENDKLSRSFSFQNFKVAMDFVNKVADLAEELQHHPDIAISYNKVRIATTTHDANGLTEKDFSLAKMVGNLSGA